MASSSTTTRSLLRVLLVAAVLLPLLALYLRPVRTQDRLYFLRVELENAALGDDSDAPPVRLDNALSERYLSAAASIRSAAAQLSTGAQASGVFEQLVASGRLHQPVLLDRHGAPLQEPAPEYLDKLPLPALPTSTVARSHPYLGERERLKLVLIAPLPPASEGAPVQRYLAAELDLSAPLRMFEHRARKRHFGCCLIDEAGRRIVGQPPPEGAANWLLSGSPGPSGAFVAQQGEMVQYWSQQALDWHVLVWVERKPQPAASHGPPLRLLAPVLAVALLLLGVLWTRA